MITSPFRDFLLFFCQKLILSGKMSKEMQPERQNEYTYPLNSNGGYN